jgi:hypothetical protein
MPRFSPIAGFLCRVVFLYAVLVAPWPGWERVGGAYFRGLADCVFGGVGTDREISFEALPERPGRARAVIVNPALMDRNGAGPVRNLDLNLDQLAIRPLALLVALIVATPVSWRRRGWAVILGLLLLHLCLLAFMGYCIWVESGEVHLVEFSPGGKAVAMGIEDAMLSQAVIALPVLLWVLVTLRQEDGSRLLGRAVSETDARAAGKIETARG